jgi:hypothetical protein
MTGTAVFDRTGAYRYLLRRVWDARLPRVVFVMLNPSTANAAHDDPTIRRCLGFALLWGCGALEAVNLFAYRAASPRVLRAAPDPVGPRNDAYLREAFRRADLLVAAWGNGGALQNRDAAVLGLMRDAPAPLCRLRRTRTGQPGHPLYVSGGTPPTPWEG